MNITVFSKSVSGEVRELVLDVLKEQGFEYDPAKDFDLDDIDGYYLQSGGVFYVGISDGKIIGTSAVRRIDQKQCEIKRIYVRKEFRNMGFGRELFLRAVEFAGENYSITVLKTDARLIKAIGLYLKNGFSVVNEKNDVLYFEKNLTDVRVDLHYNSSINYI
ncbi:MAG: GNAT family N-acetyltransferase [Methanosarcinaceae archaeon]